jgi:peptidoglycan-N-acetylglucosamine deacetylase
MRGTANFCTVYPCFFHNQEHSLVPSIIYNPFRMLGLVALCSAGAVFAGYHTMYPPSQLYGSTFIGLPRGSRDIALTFDDGPNEPFTVQLLEVLAKHGARATFFMIGKYVDPRPDIVRAVVAAGHCVGNHTYTHPNLIFQSQWQLKDEIARCERALTDAVGDRHFPIFRPPFGGRRPATLRVIRAAGLTPVLWNITGYDWNATSAEYIQHKVTSKIRGGDVILLHDGGHLHFGSDRSFTVKAVDHLLTRYCGEGYSFKTIPEMMAQAGNQRQA